MASSEHIRRANWSRERIAQGMPRGLPNPSCPEDSVTISVTWLRAVLDSYLGTPSWTKGPDDA